jgi:copper chaperone CopZ
MKIEYKFMWAGLLTATTASLCCITPVLALVSGKSGFASVFSWVEPVRPYLICLTVLILSLAWYQKLKPKKRIFKKMEMNKRPKFTHSKAFFGLITGLAVLMLAFPGYAHIFYPDASQNFVGINQSDIRKVEFKINGMTCSACEEHISYEVNILFGIIRSNTSYTSGNAIVEYDHTKTTVSEIEKAINNTGYNVLFTKEK